MLFADGANLRDGLDGANLVVGVHDGHQACLLGDGLLQLLGPDDAVLVDVQVGDGKALLLQGLAGVEHRVVLKGGGDDVVLALALHGAGSALNGPVVAFGAAAGEVDFPWLGPQAAGHRGPGLLQGALGLLAQSVKAGGVAVYFFIEGEHGLQHLGGNGGGGGVVRVNLPVHGMTFLSYFVSMGRRAARKTAGRKSSHPRPVCAYGSLNIHHFSILFNTLGRAGENFFKRALFPLGNKGEIPRLH